ncbi:MAG: hypothetical protein INR73_00410 [Williamsia sp.]|nr:hypothetical protein [Williamsia sp.]
MKFIGFLESRKWARQTLGWKGKNNLWFFIQLGFGWRNSKDRHNANLALVSSNCKSVS